jgi:hypothetical protein
MANLYSRTISAVAEVNAGNDGVADPTELLTDGVKLLFSWVILMPIAVIVSGKLITQLLRIPGQRGQSFQIKIPYLIALKAHNDEVILGFTLFIAALATTGFVAGRAVYRIFSAGFGIDPGQFNSLCIFSAFLSVVISGLVFALTRLAGQLRRRSDPVLREYDRTIDELARRMSGAAADRQHVPAEREEPK